MLHSLHPSFHTIAQISVEPFSDIHAFQVPRWLNVKGLELHDAKDVAGLGFSYAKSVSALITGLHQQQ